MGDFPYNIDDVLSLLGITHNNNKDIRTKCPLCNRRNLTINRVTEKFACYSCDGFSGRGGTALYSHINGCDTKTAYSEIMNYIGGNTAVKRERTPVVVEEENPIASVKTRHTAYSIMLSHLSLSDRHKKDLLKRGFLEKEIERLGYKTAVSQLPNEKTDNRIFEIPKDIMKRGLSLCGIPAFYKAKSKDLWLLCANKSGILVPYRSRNALIQGFQNRKNTEELDEGEDKYGWLSSNNMNMGTKSLAYIHYACDFTKNTQGEIEPVLGESVCLTEGAMKGDLFHAITGFPTICVAGVNSLTELDEELEYLKSRGVKYILIAYDMDYETNPKVAKAVETLKAKIESHGLNWQRILWDSKWKGIDDYYAYHERGIK